MVDKTLWRDGFNFLPRWPCPTCTSGHLVLIHNSLQRKETGPSVRSRHEEGPDLIDAEQRFSALLECNNPGCKQVASICGNVGFEQTYATGPDGETSVDWEPFFIPKYIEPSPPVFRIP